MIPLRSARTDRIQDQAEKPSFSLKQIPFVPTWPINRRKPLYVLAADNLLSVVDAVGALLGIPRISLAWFHVVIPQFLHILLWLMHVTLFVKLP